MVDQSVSKVDPSDIGYYNLSGDSHAKRRMRLAHSRTSSSWYSLIVHLEIL